MNVFFLICYVLGVLLFLVAAVARAANARLNTSWMVPAGLFLVFLPALILAFQTV